MVEQQQHSDLSSTFAALLANIQSLKNNIQSFREEKRKKYNQFEIIIIITYYRFVMIIITTFNLIREDTKQQKKSVHEENKKIYAADYEQSKQNKALINSAVKKITEKVESTRAHFETALEISTSRISECETRDVSVEERIQ